MACCVSGEFVVLMLVVVDIVPADVDASCSEKDAELAEPE